MIFIAKKNWYDQTYAEFCTFLADCGISVYYFSWTRDGKFISCKSFRFFSGFFLTSQSHESFWHYTHLKLGSLTTLKKKMFSRTKWKGEIFYHYMNERISFYCRIVRCSFYNEIIHRIEQKIFLKNAMLWSDHVRPQSNQTLKCQN